jgi:hypothetical protein
MENAKTTLDTMLASGAITAPVWLAYVQTGAAVVMAIGGVVLLALRIAIAWREWRTKKADQTAP